MANSPVIVEAKDCLAFPGEFGEVLRYFSEQDFSPSVFHISMRHGDSDPLISFNYLYRQWFASRYVGSVSFVYDKTEYEIQIKPRFGDIILFKMFEELFNIKFSSGSAVFNFNNTAYYLKLLISFIWLQKLAAANRHGIPKRKQLTEHSGYTIKGRMLLRPSIKTAYTNGRILSERKEQLIDPVVARILFQAYGILIKDYHLGILKIPPNALDAIQEAEKQEHSEVFVHDYEYKNIKYHPIYQNYKDVVDFSWQIIQSQPGHSSENSRKNVSGFFLDMAEIWECYIRAILRKNFSKHGWQLADALYTLYPDKFYGRKIIPDIVLKRENEVCVFDAKYKNMEFRSGVIDVDREDIFQIHTYMAYLQTKYRVVIGGLLYPTVGVPHTIDILPTKFFSNVLSETAFVVDGPVVGSQTIDCTRLFLNISSYLIPSFAEAF